MTPLSNKPSSVRLIRVDEGHYLVPGTEWEVVREPDGRRWAVYDRNERVEVFDNYKQAREWALNG